MSENPRRGRQTRNFTTNVPKILDLKSSSEQIFFRKLSLGAPGSLSITAITWTMCYHAGTMHKVAWRHFRHVVYTGIHVYESGNEKVSSGNLGSGTLADKTQAHWRWPTENWWSDPRSKLLDWQNPETRPKLSADPRSTVFFKSAKPLDLSPKSTIRELFKAKSADPRTYSPPSVQSPTSSCSWKDP